MAQILLVEDERVTRHRIQKMLEDAGYDVTPVTNGTDALSHLDKERFDLMLLDIWMPEMSGLDVLNELGNGASRPKVVVMTADDTASDASQRGASPGLSMFGETSGARRVARRRRESRTKDRNATADSSPVRQAPLDRARGAVRARRRGAHSEFSVAARRRPRDQRARSHRPCLPRDAAQRDRVGRQARPDARGAGERTSEPRR